MVKRLRFDVVIVDSESLVRVTNSDVEGKIPEEEDGDADYDDDGDDDFEDETEEAAAAAAAAAAT
ncbi:hypothetical protein Lal_00023297 [Lupinus albus]|nr:hypothetical protein Lal_00023297 [Lupinus albus]